MKEKIKFYKAMGYCQIAEFPNEYVLMFRYEDCYKVRIYENGKTWEYV